MENQYDYWYWYRIREHILDRDKCCGYCGKELTKYTVTIDHMIPSSKGGEDSCENMVASCKTCNGDKADMTPLEFFAKKLNAPVV